MKKLLFVLASGIIFSGAFAQAYTSTNIVTGLVYPVAFDIMPNGNFILTLKGDNSFPTTPGTAKIMMYSPAGVLISTFYDLSDSVNSDFERGLLGIEVDPNFTVNRYIYAYYNHNFGGDERIRVMRFTELGNVGTNPTIIFDQDVSNTIPGNHVGGNVRIDPNDPDKIFISIGDLAYQQGNPALNYAPMLSLPYGKILRVGLTGALPNVIPVTNPYYDDGNPAVGNCDYIWSYGHRNPFDFSFSTVNDSLYSSENGWNTWDECNQIHKGANYGWNYCEGFYLNGSTTVLCTLANDVLPIEDWGALLPAVTGILHYSSNVFPTLTNHLLVADNDYGRIYDITLGNPPAWDQFVARVTWGDFTAGGLTTIMEGTDGCVYAMNGGYTTTGRIMRICPVGLYADEHAAQDFFVGNPYPNPSEGNSTLTLNMLKGGTANVTIADITGRKIADVMNEQKQPGEFTVNIDAEKFGLSAGSYLINVNFAGDDGSAFAQTRKLTIVK